MFNEVVKRFEERVSFDRLRDVSLVKDVVEQVVEKLGALSRYIDAHLHSDAFAAEKPTPEMLLEEIDVFEEIRKKHRNSRKFVTTTPAKSIPEVAMNDEVESKVESTRTLRAPLVH